MLILNFVIIILIVYSPAANSLKNRHPDICTPFDSRKLYIEFGSSGELFAEDKSQFSPLIDSANSISPRKCTLELITCPSCVIHIKFKYLNISRTCANKSFSASTECGCNYILLYEPMYTNICRQQFCGRFLQNNISELTYLSNTRFITIDFVYTSNYYGRAFSLQFSAIRNRFIYDGYPTASNMNNRSQVLTSPLFPYMYPPDMSTEYAIQCHSDEPCRISLLFSDFLLADSSILEFYDSNGQRLYIISGNIFRPPVIVTSGSSLVMRFYANGATGYGFKASYSFTLGHFDNAVKKPDIDCGGQVNNLGGGITMMNMITEGVKSFDCVWIVKIPGNFLHRKTHLYVKIVNFTGFAGATELILRKGMTSSDTAVELLKYPVSRFKSRTENEHVVPINEGFYISLRGLFKPQSQVAIVYAAFNYKDCFSGLDFPCNNLRCISALLNCDGFDHCGDNSDESPECSRDPKDRREFSKIPNFLFPKTETYTDLTTTTIVFLLCTFGLIGIILVMALLLYKVNIGARHQQQIHDHIETIHAILEEGIGEIEEEIIIPDEPPDYEPPPEYSDIINYIKRVACGNHQKTKSTQNSARQCQSTSFTSTIISSINDDNFQRDSTSQRPSSKIPKTPPPAYSDVQEVLEMTSEELKIQRNVACSSSILEVKTSKLDQDSTASKINDTELKGTCMSKKHFFDSLRRSKSFTFMPVKMGNFSNMNLERFFSDSLLINESDTNRLLSRGLQRRSFSANDLLN